MAMDMCSSCGRCFFVGHGSSPSVSRTHSFAVASSSSSERFSVKSSKLVNFWEGGARGGLADTASLFHSAYPLSQTLSIEGKRRAKSSKAFPLGSGRDTVSDVCTNDENRPESRVVRSSRGVGVHAASVVVPQTEMADESGSAPSTRSWHGPLPPQPKAAPIARDDAIANKEVQRQEIIRYLEAEWNIDTDELDGIELPGTEEIMRERLEFLQSLGVEVKEVVDRYPHLLGCSVSRNFEPVLEYLDSLGINGPGLVNLIKTYPRVLHSSVVVDLHPHIGYLQGLGVKPDRIGPILGRYPDILSFRLEGTPSTSIAYLVSIGVNMRAVGLMVSMCPEILGMRVANNIKPKVEYLESLGLSKARIASMVEKRPILLRYSLASQVRSGVAALREFGIPDEALPDTIERCPSILGLSPLNESLARKSAWLQDIFGFAAKDIPRLFSESPGILVMAEPKIEQRLQFLCETGLSKADVASMILQCPEILGLSVVNILKPHVEYLVDKLGRPASELVMYPAFFTHDIAEYIVPRVEGFGERATQCNLSWMLDCDESQYRVRLDLGLTP